MLLEEAKKIAIEVGYELKEECEEGRINIAGSIRRKKPDVGDIELVCLPKQIDVMSSDLFGNAATQTKIRSQEYIRKVKQLGKIIKGKPEGRYMQIELPQGINLDLFMPNDFDYYRIYAVRTGSDHFVRNRVAVAWVKKGWVGTSDGLRKITDCKESKTPDGKSKWTCVNPNAQKPIAWKSEADFFHWLGMDYIPPQQRG